MSIRALGAAEAVVARLARRNELQVRPLNAFADEIAKETQCWTPSFDPDSGGVEAKVLLLLESPGPKVSQTGFISQDNPDQTAENMSGLLAGAGLARSSVLLWNIVPWQLSAAGVVTPTDAHLEQATPYTLRLLSLLPEVQVVVLVGKRAERGWGYVAPLLERDVMTLACPHPSPLSFNTRPQQRVLALERLKQAATLLGTGDQPPPSLQTL